MKKFTVSCVGCCLVDRLYNNISFKADTFNSYTSRRNGDGGLIPGQLVFKEEFEKFAGKDLDTTLKAITKGRKPDKISIGGPGIVALINAAQIVGGKECVFRFYGRGGKDDDGKHLVSLLKKMPVSIENYTLQGNTTPSTIVLTDPDYNNGNGERIFINTIGEAWQYFPDDLGDDFFSSDILIFGGTALVPVIHDHLTELLEKAKKKHCITVVNTVYDFRNEKINPAIKWPLGNDDSSYRNIDLLLVNMEEALRLSGKREPDKAIQFFREKGVGALIITNGSKNIHLFSDGRFFKTLRDTELPVSTAISENLRSGNKGDTTGCGDNFAGGVIASLITQLQKKENSPDLIDAASWGIVSGGYSCFYIGGVYFEKIQGEKLGLIQPYYEEYRKQIGL